MTEHAETQRISPGQGSASTWSSLDTDDPPRMAEFYTALLGWQVERTEDDWITLRGDGNARIAFQLALNHKRPTWPDNDRAAAVSLRLRGRRPGGGRGVRGLDRGPAGRGARPIDQFRVFLDPSGHPFCLCR